MLRTDDGRTTGTRGILRGPRGPKNIDIDKEILENIDKEILENIDIDKISND